ncbi:PAS domain S-box-containing protein [Sphingomonas jejuensis]|uniref:histidine kinase n=1 Tax=Sphingomonas jejuensis TaxID=904715 RepID=A0ABX0XM72_9SPHN|nr:PAS domain S-box-containing protein [Sphingomonas jejuensis]
MVSDAPTQQNDSEARFRLLLGNIAQAFWETDPDGVVVVDSSSWRAYTGQSVDEWMGYGWLGAIHPDDRAFAERQWRASVAARRLVDAEFRLQAPDGGWRWTNVRAAPMLAADGRIARWLGMNIDIDARKRAEAALRESEARFRTLADTAPALIWFNDPDGNNIFVNQVCLDYTGRSQAEIAGSGWRGLLDPQLEAAYTAGYLAAILERREWRDRTRIRRWDGAWHWFENHARPMVSDDGS